ncbi:MAG TPA: GNAT family N-acetyltransferase [Devosiaceae bacterium]
MERKWLKYLDKQDDQLTLNIRRAERTDAATVFRFIRALAEYEKLLDKVDAREEDILRDLFGPEPRVFCEIAEWEGQPVGFALWFYTYSTFRGRHGIWLEDLFVQPEYRGKGIGKALMIELARRCAEEGLPRFAWWVLNWNQPSIDFYKAMGAVMLDEWTVCRVEGEALTALAAR